MLAAAICVDAAVTAILSKLGGVFTLKIKIFFPATTNSNLYIFPIYNDKIMRKTLVNKLVASSYQHIYG